VSAVGGGLILLLLIIIIILVVRGRRRGARGNLSNIKPSTQTILHDAYGMQSIPSQPQLTRLTFTSDEISV
jgi:hypothetical protein